MDYDKKTANKEHAQDAKQAPKPDSLDGLFESDQQQKRFEHVAKMLPGFEYAALMQEAYRSTKDPSAAAYVLASAGDKIPEAAKKVLNAYVGLAFLDAAGKDEGYGSSARRQIAKQYFKASGLELQLEPGKTKAYSVP